MDESEQNTKSELSDSWMVINETTADQAKDIGVPSDGSDGESVEVIDQEEYEEVITGETDYDAAQTDEEVNGPKNKKYVHHPNNDVNAALNRLMVIAASVVVGLAVGHYLGYSEEVNDMATTMKKLQAENFKLKNHICMALENYDNHITHITGSTYPELKHISENYAVFLTILLNLTCPHTEDKVLGLQTSLNDVRLALLNSHMSAGELHDRIGQILKSHSNGHEVVDYKNFPKEALVNLIETVSRQDIGLSAIVSQTTKTVTFGEHASEIHAQVESLTAKQQDESTFKMEIHEKVTWPSPLNGVPVRVRVQEEEIESALSEGLINSPAKSPSKISKGCHAATGSKASPVNTEVPNKSMLKHMVKDVVQEITESVLALHHDDIIRDIRNEANKLMHSFPVFKSALLINMEVTSKLKSHLKYIKDMLYSVLENSPHMTEKGKIDEIFSSVNLHELHLEKAMDSLQLIEVTLNPKRTNKLNVEKSNVCTVSDFLKEIFINNHHNTRTMELNIKHSNYPHLKNHKYTANQPLSGKNVIDEAAVDNFPQKSFIESDEKISNSEYFQKTDDDNKLFTQQPFHGRPCKYDKRERCEIKEKNKEKQDHDRKKNKKSEQHSADAKRYNEKDERKYKDFKTPKEKFHDKGKTVRKQYHYKEEKHFKRELRDTRKKNSQNIYRWHKADDFRHSNMSGDWVIDMNRARAEARENEHKSDWLFERAYSRKAKRNGKWDMNNWYFQRAEGRKSCRQKTGSEKNKGPYPPPNDPEKEYHDNNNKQHQKQRRYFKPKRWISKAYMTVSKFRF